MTTSHDEQLQRSLAGARPPSPAEDPAVLRSLAELNRAVAAQARLQDHDRAPAPSSHAAVSGAPPRQGRRRVSRGTRVAVLALAGTLVTGTAAAASFHAARTGFFGPAGMSENDTTEWLDTGADDLPAVAADLAPAYVTYSPGVDAAAATAWVVDTARGAGGLVSETGLARSYAAYGQCSWLAAWRSTSPGDPLHAEAAGELATSATWPVFAATDGGGILASMTSLADAAAAEDGARVAELAPLACDTGLLTELGVAVRDGSR